MSGFSVKVLKLLSFEGIGFESEANVRQYDGGSCARGIFLKKKIHSNRPVIAVQRSTELF